MASVSLLPIIIVVFIADTYLTNIIDTNTSNQFQNQQIYCNEGEDCTIICDVTQACFQSTIHCPAKPYSCSIQCLADSDNKQVCGAAKFNCSETNQCDILCRSLTNDHACDNANVKWPINSDHSSQSSLNCTGGQSCANLASSGKITQGWDPIKASNDNQDYTLICNGQNSCHNNIIECPSNASCSILCNDYSSCQGNTIQCGNTANAHCTVTCRNEGDYASGACQDAQFDGIGTVSCDGPRSCRKLIFPISPNGEPHYLDCNDQESCFESKVTCPTDSGCHIRCKGETSCTGMVITWPPSSYPASLTCLNEDACTNINMPDHVERLTFGPTVSPTSYQVPKYGVTVNIIFDYTQDDEYLNETEIQLLTAQITHFIIEDSLFNQSITCSEEQYQFNITLKEIDITVELELCNEIEATKLVAFLNRNLASDLVEQYEQEPDILIVSTPTVQIVVAQVIETTAISSTENTILTNINDSNQSDDTTSTVIITLVVIIGVLVIVIASLLYCYLKKTSVRKETSEIQLKKELESQEIEIEQRDQTQVESNNSTNDQTTISDEMHQEIDDDDGNEDLYTKNDDELIKGKITPLIRKATPGQEPTPLGDV